MQMDGFLTLKGGNVELVGAPETIFVLPIGHVVSSKGEFDVDDESYKAMIPTDSRYESTCGFSLLPRGK